MVVHSALGIKVLSIMDQAHLCSKAYTSVRCTQMLEEVREASSKQNILFHLIESKIVTFERAGRDERMTLKKANDYFISEYYPNIERQLYCWPKVKQFMNYEKTTSELLAEGDKSKTTKKSDLRRGDLAECNTREMFETMFREKGIPSFSISGYKWDGQFLSNLCKNIRKTFKNLHEMSEIDLMIAIPNKCILLFDVKSVEDEELHVKAKVSYGLEQCAKHIDILSTVLADVSRSCRIPIISLVALPNVHRKIVNKLYCKSCSKHIVTGEDHEDVTKLHSWFQQLMSKHSSDINRSQFDEKIFKKLIGRLVGPSSVKKFVTNSDAIEDTVFKINEVSHTLSEQQLNAYLQSDEKFIWITGAPGSGKTMLVQYKASNIIHMAAGGGCGQTTEGFQMKHVLYIINGSSPEKEQSCLMKLYKQKFGTGNDSCEVCVRECHEMEEYISDFKIPELIDNLQRKHGDKIVHVILEECQKKLQTVDLKTNWRESVDENRLGNIWIVQNFFAAKDDSTDDLSRLPGFKLIKLEKIMRLSSENRELLRILFDPGYDLGHKVKGPIPVVYRMSCICSTESTNSTDTKKYHCPTCFDMRVAHMLCKAIKDIQANSSMALCIRNAFITSLFTKEKLTELLRYCDASFSVLAYNEPPTKAWPGTFLTATIGHFIGCERSHVFVDFNCILQNDYSAMTSLTRAVGQLILIDGGNYDEKDGIKYDDKIRTLKATQNQPFVEIKEMESENAKKAVSAYLKVKQMETNVSTDIVIKKLITIPRRCCFL